MLLVVLDYDVLGRAELGQAFLVLVGIFIRIVVFVILALGVGD